MRSRPSLLIVSHACSRAVNRDPYAAMTELGWRVLVVTVDGLREGGRWLPSDPPEHPGLEIRFLPMFGRHARLQCFQGLVAVIEAERPDWVVLDNDLHSLQALQLAVHKRRLGFRLGVLSCENQPFTPSALWRRRGLRGAALGVAMSAMRHWIRPRVDLLFSINHAGVELYRAAGFRRVEWTPLGFPERHFHVDPDAAAAMRAKLGIEAPVIAYFGRMVAEKGVHILLDALDRITDLPWHFMLDDFQADSGYQQTIQQRIEAASWGDRVVRIHARHGEVAAYMNAADIVVLPSLSTPAWSEQYGRVLPEALACGCQVLASDCGELPHLAPTMVTVHAQGDSEELAKQLRQVLTLETSGREIRRVIAAEAANLGSMAHAALWSEVLAVADAAEVSSTRRVA